MDIKVESLKKHAEWEGKIEVVSRIPIETREDLSLAYTPGVAEPCLAIQKDPMLSFKLTRRSNLVAVITDGTAVLGLGNIGPEAGMPVMEGKCALFKTFADVDAFPICVRTTDVDELVRTIYLISGSFGGINLEDIAAPRCFEVEKKLIELCDIPVFHDDQHGTAIVTGAALINALRLNGKKIDEVKVVISGAGAAGIAICKHLMNLGVKHVTMCGSKGIIHVGGARQTEPQNEIAKVTNLENKIGTLADAMVGADVFVGVSAPGIVTKEMVASMANDPIVFAMANPTPEVMPEAAKEAGARIIGTGRSDYPNQINNVLVFPGLFRGALDCRASCINDEMKVAATWALADLIPQNELTPDHIILQALDHSVAEKVAEAVKTAAIRSGVARITE